MDDPLLAAFKTKRIQVYRNGDAFSSAKLVIVNHRLYKNWEQLLHHIGIESCLVGAVRRLYQLIEDTSGGLPQGKRINALHEIKDGASYVATGTEAFKRIPYGAKAKASAEATSRLITAKQATAHRKNGAPLPFSDKSKQGPSSLKQDLNEGIFDANVKSKSTYTCLFFFFLTLF